MSARSLLNAPTSLSAFRRTLCVILVAAAALFIVATWHWPLVGDASFFHYMVMLLRRGQAPYRDFIDVNLPGTYAVQAAVIACLGSGSRGFRLFDLGLLSRMAAAMFFLCRANAGKVQEREIILPALFSATLFAIVHGRDGIIHQGQRDLVLAVLYVGACAFLEKALRPNTGSVSNRHASLAPSFFSGLLFGFACTIKPSALFMIVPLFAMFVLQLRRQRRALLPTSIAFITAALLAPLLALGYLIQQHTLRAFWQMLTQLTPYHASLNRLSIAALILGSVSSVCLPLFLIWLAIFLSQRRYNRLLDQLLLIGFLAGCCSYVLQGRGYPYHRYPSEAFLLLLAALAFCDALWPLPGSQRTPPWVRFAAIVGLSVGTFFLVPRSLQLILHFDPRDQFTSDLRAALNSQGGPALDRRVQCLDGYSGCLNTLQQMHLAESTGYLYDCYLYSVPGPTAPLLLEERDRYRKSFQEAVLQHPPKLFVVSSQSCGGAVSYSYAKLGQWSWLEHYLGTQYRLIDDHVPSEQVRWGGRPQPPTGFRIYSRIREP